MNAVPEQPIETKSLSSIEEKLVANAVQQMWQATRTLSGLARQHALVRIAAASITAVHGDDEETALALSEDIWRRTDLVVREVCAMRKTRRPARQPAAAGQDL